MNSLSWLLYWAGVVGALQFYLCMLGLVAGGGAIVCITSICVEGAKVRGLAAVLIPLHLLFVLASIAIPSSSTLYAIAASQYGEQLAKNETVQGVANEATAALRSWLRKQTEGK